MSDILAGGDGELLGDAEQPLDDANASEGTIGMTSEEVANDSDGDSKKGLFDITIYEAMLLISLVCIALATLKMFLALREYGEFPREFPWKIK